MESDLHIVIQSKILQHMHKVYILYQILLSLHYIHSADIVHRDIKPSNVLVNSNMKISVADLGLAWSVSCKDTISNQMTDYVATLWYRAPEILLGSTKYNKSVDIWSFGCILVELYTGWVLFNGESTIQQI